MPAADTAYIQLCLDRWSDGEQRARDDLIEATCERVRALTRKMLAGYSRLRRWEETDDVFVNAMMRLTKALAATKPESVRHFFRLATLQIRRELVDLARHYFGPQGKAAKHVTREFDDSTMQSPAAQPEDVTHEPGQLASWGELHSCVDQLPEAEREVFELLWYHEVSQVEAAKLLGVDRRTVIRRWQAACVQLHDAMQGQLPGIG